MNGPEKTGFTVIVSGYPRSGTSLMMQMLAAGGLPVLWDNRREPDENNPRGYFEYERALNIGMEGETDDWLSGTEGKAVKIIAFRLRYLPEKFSYRVLFMRRNIVEVLASCRKMGLIRWKTNLNEREQIMSFKTEYAVYETRLLKQPRIRALYVQYNDLFDSPTAQIDRICAFLEIPLDKQAMAAAIDPSLYRNRFEPKVLFGSRTEKPAERG